MTEFPARRSVPEWIGSTPDTPIPKAVRLRVFREHNGICHLSNRKITVADQWDCDHVLAIIDGGENRETNLAPALRTEHRKKTAGEVTRTSKSDRMALAHWGLKQPKGRGFDKRLKKKMDGSVVPRDPPSSFQDNQHE